MIDIGLQGWEMAFTGIGCVCALAGLAVLAYEAFDVWTYGIEKESDEKG